MADSPVRTQVASCVVLCLLPGAFFCCVFSVLLQNVKACFMFNMFRDVVAVCGIFVVVLCVCRTYMSHRVIK